jgi:ubiquinol-cytochrome c reductase cytochrome c subunit
MNRIVCGIVVLIGIAAAGMHAQGTAPAGNAESGKAVFIKAKCFSCHGTVGQGGPGGRLAPKPVAFAAFRTFVRQGKVNSPATNRNWAGMPPFSTKFISDTELADIYAYLTSIPEPPAPASIPLLSQP